MEINRKRIDENTWIFEEDGVRFFLLVGTERTLLIDSGMQTRNAKELAGELTALPLSLLNTHADPDHIGSSDEFDSFYMHPAEASNYYNSQKRAGTMLSKIRKFRFRPKSKLCRNPNYWMDKYIIVGTWSGKS